jgi:hypothetical protein
VHVPVMHYDVIRLCAELGSGQLRVIHLTGVGAVALGQLPPEELENPVSSLDAGDSLPIAGVCHKRAMAARSVLVASFQTTTSSPLRLTSLLAWCAWRKSRSALCISRSRSASPAESVRSGPARTAPALDCTRHLLGGVPSKNFCSQRKPACNFYWLQPGSQY